MVTFYYAIWNAEIIPASAPITKIQSYFTMLSLSLSFSLPYCKSLDPYLNEKQSFKIWHKPLRMRM